MLSALLWQHPVPVLAIGESTLASPREVSVGQHAHTHTHTRHTHTWRFYLWDPSLNPRGYDWWRQSLRPRSVLRCWHHPPLLCESRFREGSAPKSPSSPLLPPLAPPPPLLSARPPPTLHPAHPPPTMHSTTTRQPPSTSLPTSHNSPHTPSVPSEGYSDNWCRNGRLWLDMWHCLFKPAQYASTMSQTSPGRRLATITCAETFDPIIDPTHMSSGPVCLSREFSTLLANI